MTITPRKLAFFVSRALVFTASGSFFFLAIGLYCVFYIAPPDYQQGLAVRIMYIHVPAAWLSLFFYSLMGLMAFVTLIWRNPLADVIHHAATPIGALFTFVCLATGALWGKPMWGTWWVWDARLTSELILFFLYCSLMILRTMMTHQNRSGATVLALLTLVGCINLPIIKFSVEWWNTLHQPASVFKLSGPSIHISMLTPLMIMTAGFLCLGLTLQFLRILVLLFKKTILATQRQKAYKR